MHNANSFELGPHPADPHSTGLCSPTEEFSRFLGPHAERKTAPSDEIWVYEGNGGLAFRIAQVFRFQYFSYVGPIPSGDSKSRSRLGSIRWLSSTVLTMARNWNFMSQAEHKICGGLPTLYARSYVT